MWFFDLTILSWVLVIGAAVLGFGYWPVAAIVAVYVVRVPKLQTAILIVGLAFLVAGLSLNSPGKLATVWLLVAGAYWLISNILDEASLTITALVAFLTVVAMDWSRGQLAVLSWVGAVALALCLDWLRIRSKANKIRIH